MPIEDTEKLAHHGREELATLLDIVNNEDFQFVNATEAYRELRHMKSAVKVTPALRSARSASDFIAQLLGTVAYASRPRKFIPLHTLAAPYTIVLFLILC